MNYQDLSRPNTREKYPEVVAGLQKGQLALPAVFVDDQVVSQGYVDYFSIARAIDKTRRDASPTP